MASSSTRPVGSSVSAASNTQSTSSTGTTTTTTPIDTKSINQALAAGIPSALSHAETWSLLAFVAACAAVLANTVRRSDGAPLTASLALSGIAFAASYAMIRWLGPTFVAAGIRGADLNKTHRRVLPECMGAVCAIVYLLAIIVFIPVPFYKDIVAATSGGGNRDVVLSATHVQRGRLLHLFPHSKFFIPAFAAIPLLVVYFTDFGVTSVVVPTALQPYLGDLVNLGPLYYLYMTAVAIFSPNSINILAGINGIEVAQSVVIAALLILNDGLYLLAEPYPHPATDSHLFSLYFLLPFLGVSLALLAHNWYPARVFVGDTYCYFAGMVFVVVSILGHFSKTLILLLLPQIANFAYSAPQIFGLVPCPRHRMPRFNARTTLLEPSVTVWSPDRQPKAPVAATLRLLARLHLLRLVEDPTTGQIQETSNLTLLNLWLVWRGPMREDRLALEVTGVQTVVGLLGLFVRHRLARLIFKEDNWGPV
ncbi:udp-n-acetyl-glucosamine-1-p transferase [Grosmannia clavigera kw1407]|uniref:UDP-N-acetylglucosamine--dolichyl-phosphate N-acetylglucosaminephosphotransferase n=1 Tax=Grosmannia clavigera (strain kw1407 / UAMH 11150) TaxID=655863 RepID=F0XFJ4_GROCL|nr:udp-n-acetyl-glucosamine-1-p transferase [Grosmannia clavigera kw1407]EFX03837.1 udp-n-acetyl-glucosamine-1-p transferase [Grosmannia clavigera kw1407]